MKQLQNFSEEPAFNYQMNRWYRSIGEASYEDIKAIGEKVTSTKEYIEEFLKLAKLREEEGEIKKAAYYYRAAEFFVFPTASNKQDLRRKVVELMKQVFDIKEEQHFEVPYEGTFLSAYQFKVQKAKGTIVLFGGYDSYIEELGHIFKYFNQKGYSVIAFEGPGQGTTLNEKGLALDYKWEKPVSGILDFFGLEDVTLIGMSLGGMLAIRAAAYEKRVKRVIAFDVMYDFYESFESQCSPAVREKLGMLMDGKRKGIVNEIMKKSMAAMPKVAWAISQGMHATGTNTPYDYLEAIKKFTTIECSVLVDQDVLLLAGTKDQYVPIDMVYKQMQDLVNAKSITTRIFTEKENAADHCQTSNVLLALDEISNWIGRIEK